MPVRRMGGSHGGGRASRLWLVVGLVLLVVVGVHDLSTRNRLSELEQEHSNIRKERDTLNSQASQCGTDLHDLTVKQKMCENERADDKRAYTQKVDTLQQQLDALKESETDKSKQISKLEADMKTQAADAEAEKNRLQTDLNECHEQLETARKSSEAQVVEQQDKHEKLQKTHQELQEEFDHIKEQLQLKQAMYDEAHDALQALQAKYDKQTENLEALKKELEQTGAQPGGRDTVVESVHLDDNALHMRHKDSAAKEDKHGGFDPDLLQARAQERMKPQLPKPPGPNHSDQDAEAAEKEIAALNDAAHAHQMRRSSDQQSAFVDDDEVEGEQAQEQGAEEDRRRQAAAARGAPLRHEVEEGGGIGDGAERLDESARVGRRQPEPEAAEDYEEEEDDEYGEDDDAYGEYADDDAEAQDGEDKAVDMPQDGAAAVVAPHRQLVAREGAETEGNAEGAEEHADMVDRLRQQQEAEDNRGDIADAAFERQSRLANDRHAGFIDDEGMQQQHQRQQQQQQQAEEWRADVGDAGFQPQRQEEEKAQAQDDGRPHDARQEDANPRQLIAEDI